MTGGSRLKLLGALIECGTVNVYKPPYAGRGDTDAPLTAPADRAGEHIPRLRHAHSQSCVRKAAGWMIRRWRPSSTVPVWTGSPLQSWR